MRNTECSSLGGVRHFSVKLPPVQIILLSLYSRTQTGLVKPYWRTFSGKGKEEIICHAVVDTFLASWSEGRAGERSVFISWYCCHHRHNCSRRAPKNRSQEMPELQTYLCWVRMAQLDSWSGDVVPPWQDVDGALLRAWLCRVSA